MRPIALLVLLFASASCKPKAIRPTQGYGDSCSENAQCISGLCEVGGSGARFCSQNCSLDSGCFNDKSLYCCELSSGTQPMCQPAGGGACATAELGTQCNGTADPLCARSGLQCAQVDTGQVCTKACNTNQDCAALAGATCGTSDGRALCVPTLTLQTDCGGDSDCPTGQLCQIVANNKSNPTGVVTICSTTTDGPGAAFSACDPNSTSNQCELPFCLAGECPSTCLNDTYCPVGYVCTGLVVGLSSTTAGFVVDLSSAAAGLVGVCTKAPGSMTPCTQACDPSCTPPAACPCTTTNCPTGEACGTFWRPDGTQDSVCQTTPSVSGATNDVVLGDVCSPLVQSSSAPPARSPVVAGSNPAAVRVCESVIAPLSGGDACLPADAKQDIGYCTAPCERDADCPTAQATGGAALPMHCVFDAIPYEYGEICLLDDFNAAGILSNFSAAGALNGAPCSGSSQQVADAECASAYCDTVNTKACAPRLAARAACTSNDQCLSRVCDSTCLQPCRSQSDCLVGEACTASVYQLQTGIIELPLLCQAIAGVATPSVPCHGEATGCAAGQVCRVVIAADGSSSGVCAGPPSAGVTMGKSCSTNADCNSNACFLTTQTCLASCLDDTDCTSGERCMPFDLFSTAVNLFCLAPVAAAAADGAACKAPADCQSNLCANGACAALCLAGSSATTANGASPFCVPTALDIESRSPVSTVGDRYSYVLANLSANPPAVCNANSGAKTCVFVPTSQATMQGYLTTPNPDARAAGQPCHVATNCQSGLCITGACAQGCVSVSDCASGQTCSPGNAMTYEGQVMTATVNVCTG